MLADPLASVPGDGGKWFAPAKELALYDDAIDLAIRSQCDPKTPIRASRDFETSDPVFALKAGLTALRWLCAGHGYDLVGNEAYQAFDYVIRAADRAGDREGAPTAMATLIHPDMGATNGAGDALRRLLAGASQADRSAPRS